MAAAPRRSLRLFRAHAFMNAFLADFADVARLYFIMRVDAGSFFGGESSASFYILIVSCVSATRYLSFPIALFLDTVPYPEEYARAGCLVAAVVWTCLAAANRFTPEVAAAFVAAEVGTTVWSCALDAVRVKAHDLESAEAMQIAQISAAQAGIAAALSLGGLAAQALPNPLHVFAMVAAFTWASFFLPSPPCESQITPTAIVSGESVAESARSVLESVRPWFFVNAAVLCVPGTTDAVTYFLARARNFNAVDLGALGATACVLSALSAMVAEKRVSWESALGWGAIASAGAIGLTTLASTSAEAERVPTWVRALCACVVMAAQVAMSVPFYSSVAKKLAEKGETRSAVNALVQTIGSAPGFVGAALTFAMSREFRISGNTLRGVEPLLHVGATLSSLPMIVVGNVHRFRA
jgi:hypothetical protein